MNDMITPERKRELYEQIREFLRVHYDTVRLPAVRVPSGTPAALEGEGRAAVPEKCGAVLDERAGEEDGRDDDWDILERIFAQGTWEPRARTIRDLVEEAEREETFSQALLRMIGEKGLTEPQVYKRIFMDRKLFNRIRNTPDYQPSKRTALLLALGLRLNLAETEAFLAKAGFSLSSWNKSDVIVEYFIASGNYNVLEINEMLAEFHMPLLLRGG